MFSSTSQSIIIFIVVCTIIILVLITFITIIIYKYQKKQNIYFKNIEELEIRHKNTLLESQLEIQEQTFQNISREIHDNIGQKLTLAKLHLNTLDSLSNLKSLQVEESVKMIGEAINDLSDISRSMSSEILLNNGLIKALEFEAGLLNKTNLYNINLLVSGETVFLESNKELILFRIAQEALNNIIKHSGASSIDLHLDYKNDSLILSVNDNGRGFDPLNNKKMCTGLTNIKKRTSMLNGICSIESEINSGTTIKIQIPIDEIRTIA